MAGGASALGPVLAPTLVPGAVIDASPTHARRRIRTLEPA